MAGLPRSIPLTSIDLEADPVEYSAMIVDNTAAATVTVEGSNVIVRPTPGFLGTFRLRVGVKQQGATDRGSPGSDPFDYQTIDVQVVPLTIARPACRCRRWPAWRPPASWPASPPRGAATDFGRRLLRRRHDGPRHVVANGQGGFDVGTHTYATTGTFPIEVTITGAGGVTEAATTTAPVAPPTIVRPVCRSRRSPRRRSPASWPASPPTGARRPTSRVVTFDDGTTAPGTIVANGQGGFDVSATHTYATTGPSPSA